MILKGLSIKTLNTAAAVTHGCECLASSQSDDETALDLDVDAIVLNYAILSAATVTFFYGLKIYLQMVKLAFLMIHRTGRNSHLLKNNP